MNVYTKLIWKVFADIVFHLLQYNICTKQQLKPYQLVFHGNV